MDTEEKTPDDVRQVLRRQGLILGISVAATVVVNFPYYLPLFPDFGDWLYAGMFLSCGLMAIVPFLLARMAPRAAGFDTQWFPNAWSQWVWFLGLVILLFVCTAISTLLVGFVPLKYTAPLLRPGFTPDCTFTGVIRHGIILVLLCPIAEEIFWRGYLLEQLRKLMHSGTALLIQSLLFSLSHLPLIIPRIGGFQASIAFFFYGAIFGMWRIRFRSILPLILAHIVLNGVASIPILKHQYDLAGLTADLTATGDLSADFAAKIRLSPKCQQIYLLTREPVEKAVPAIIGFFADPDEGVRVYAMGVLIEHYRDDSEFYLKEALASKDKKIIDGVLFVIGMNHLSGLKQEVRTIAWSVDDEHVQFSAALTLDLLRDVEGLQRIVQDHPSETVRRAAKRSLAAMEEKR